MQAIRHLIEPRLARERRIALERCERIGSEMDSLLAEVNAMLADFLSQ